jgi:drug/metabolite transporter (DMT)-like permease
MNSLLRGNALLALAAAVLWGGGDFSGGMAVKSAGGAVRAALRVVLLSHAASFTVLVTVAHLRGDPRPHGALLAWGIAAGVAGGLSLTAFYTALSRGAMGASAAVSGLLAAAIPAAFTLWRQGTPGARSMLGFAAAGLAIRLIAASQPVNPDSGPSQIARGASSLALLAGLGFGLYFIALSNAGPAGVLWPMASARIGSLSVCSLVLLALSLRAPAPAEAAARLTRLAVVWTLSTALLDTSGNLLFIAATRAGRLDVAAVLASLYPASTIMLAALVLGERPTRRQALGMATAAIAIVLIAL